MITSTSKKPRLEMVDALRGLALLGIVLIHNIDHFDLSNTVISSFPFLVFLDTIIQDQVFLYSEGNPMLFLHSYSDLVFLYSLKINESRE